MAAKKPAESAPLKTYDVQSPLEHDGVRYAIGEQVELSDKSFNALPPGTVSEPVGEAV